MISYDLASNSQKDLFYVWVEIEKNNGEAGEFIRPGSRKNITWVPGSDNIFLNEEIFVEVKAERYVPAFNKGRCFTDIEN